MCKNAAVQVDDIKMGQYSTMVRTKRCAAIRQGGSCYLEVADMRARKKKRIHTTTGCARGGMLEPSNGRTNLPPGCDTEAPGEHFFESWALTISDKKGARVAAI